ncbi:hypothetical protein ABMY26_26435 [Azospirillum sp. HJ39]|uniref:hypothetical protein n=1 Tax=Azospirillum sp. HJ39 TaxID=3159496 RepID=UPI00355792AE
MSDVAGMKAMLAGVFAKAAEAKGKAARKPAPSTARNIPPVPGGDPAVRLSLAAGMVGDALAGPSGGSPAGLAEQLGPAIQALARDLGRLLAAFGMDADGVAAAEAALAGRFGDAERRAAVTALDGPAGDFGPVTADAGAGDVAVEVHGIGLRVAAGPASPCFEAAALVLAHVPAEGGSGGFAAAIGALRSAIRPGRGLTVEADGIPADGLGPVMEALAGAMTGPPGGLEGTVVLSPRNVPAAGGPLDLSLTLSGRLGAGTAVPSAPPAAPAKGKPVEPFGERGVDVRI